ncbi:MAG: hypothetical protein U0670_10600 [Anaerolineae bacterium]
MAKGTGEGRRGLFRTIGMTMLNFARNHIRRHVASVNQPLALPPPSWKTQVETPLVWRETVDTPSDPYAEGYDADYTDYGWGYAESGYESPTPSSGQQAPQPPAISRRTQPPSAPQPRPTAPGQPPIQRRPAPPNVQPPAQPSSQSFAPNRVQRTAQPPVQASSTPPPVQRTPQTPQSPSQPRSQPPSQPPSARPSSPAPTTYRPTPTPDIIRRSYDALINKLRTEAEEKGDTFIEPSVSMFDDSGKMKAEFRADKGDDQRPLYMQNQPNDPSKSIMRTTRRRRGAVVDLTPPHTEHGSVTPESVNVDADSPAAELSALFTPPPIAVPAAPGVQRNVDTPSGAPAEPPTEMPTEMPSDVPLEMASESADVDEMFAGMPSETTTSHPDARVQRTLADAVPSQAYEEIPSAPPADPADYTGDEAGSGDDDDFGGWELDVPPSPPDLPPDTPPTAPSGKPSGAPPSGGSASGPSAAPSIRRSPADPSTPQNPPQLQRDVDESIHENEYEGDTSPDMTDGVLGADWGETSFEMPPADAPTMTPSTPVVRRTPTDRPTDRLTDRPTDRPADRPIDRAADRAADHLPMPPSAQPPAPQAPASIQRQPVTPPVSVPPQAVPPQSAPPVQRSPQPTLQRRSPRPRRHPGAAIDYSQCVPAIDSARN